MAMAITSATTLRSHATPVAVLMHESTAADAESPIAPSNPPTQANMACMIGSPSTHAKSSFTALREFMVVGASVGQLLSGINYAAAIVGKVGAFSDVSYRLSMVCGLAAFFQVRPR